THAINLDQNGYPCKPTRIVTTDAKTAPIDKHSVEIVWSPKSTSNQLLGLIRQFAKHKGTVENPKGLLNSPKDRRRMFDLLTELAKEIKSVLKSEPRLPNIRYH